MADPLFRIYETFYRVDQYSDVLYNNNIYTSISIVSTITIISALLLFYKFIDPLPKRVWKYLVVLISIISICFLWSCYYVSNESGIRDLILRDEGPKSRFAIVIATINSIYTLILGFVLSFLFKLMSTNNSNNPI